MKLICHLFFLIFTMTFQLGCIETPTGSQDPSQSDSVTADRVDSEAKKQPNPGKVHIVAEKKFPSKSDPFDVMKASIHDDMLKLTVEYGGGCRAHTFSLYWNGQFREESPESIELKIIHNANHDSCEAIVTEEVFFNLEPIKKADLAVKPNPEGREISIELSQHQKKLLYRF